MSKKAGRSLPPAVAINHPLSLVVMRSAYPVMCLSNRLGMTYFLRWRWEHRPRQAGPGRAGKRLVCLRCAARRAVRGVRGRVVAPADRAAVGVIGAGVKTPAGETVDELWKNL